MKTTLCTYTFNDAPLLHGLLERVPDWTVQPDEIVIVDDGSDVPFTMEGEMEGTLPIRLIRLPKNRGFATAKRTGIDAAGGEVILSVDCDARPCNTYLEVCRKRLEDPTIGMVSGGSRYVSGSDAVSRYQALFGDNYHTSHHGSVDFIPGHAFALCRDTWAAIHGFGGHTRQVCEDHALCASLQAHKYQLFIDSAISVTQIRRLSRVAHCARLWVWREPVIRERLDTGRHLPVQTAQLFLSPMMERLPFISASGDLALSYLELYNLVFCCLKSCSLYAEKLQESGKQLSPGALSMPSIEASTLASAVHARFKVFPRLYTLLKTDLLMAGLRLGGVLPSVQSVPSLVTDWQVLDNFFAAMQGEGLFHWLEREGVEELLNDEKGNPSDFSAYTHAGLTWK